MTTSNHLTRRTLLAGAAGLSAAALGSGSSIAGSGTLDVELALAALIADIRAVPGSVPVGTYAMLNAVADRLERICGLDSREALDRFDTLIADIEWRERQHPPRWEGYQPTTPALRRVMAGDLLSGRAA